MEEIVYTNELACNVDMSIRISVKSNKVVLHINGIKYIRDRTLLDLGKKFYIYAKQFSLGLNEGNRSIDEISLEFFNKIIKNGRIYFNIIFGNELIDIYNIQIREIQSYKVPIIEISGDNLNVPWGLLFDSEINLGINFNNFTHGLWATSKIVSNLGSKNRLKFNGKLEVPEKLKIGIIADLNFPDVLDEISEFSKFNDFVEIEELNMSTIGQYDLVTHVNTFINKKHDILHIACHVSYKDKKWIFYFNDLEYAIDEIYLDPLVDLSYTKLIFLNGCFTGYSKSFGTFNILSALTQNTYANFITLETAVESKVGKRVSSNFYEYLLFQGKTIGEALFESKVKNLDITNDINNIYLIFYALYGSHSLNFKLNNKKNGIHN